MTPIRIVCLGTESNPATSEDIREACDYLKKKKNKKLPSSWPISHRTYFVERERSLGSFILNVGSPIRPATEFDLSDVSDLLVENINNENLTIFTHHCFNLEWRKGIKSVSLNME